MNRSTDTFLLILTTLAALVCVASCRDTNSEEIQKVIATRLILETVADEIQSHFKRRVSDRDSAERISLHESLAGTFLSSGQANYLEFFGPSAAVEVGIVDSWGRGILIAKQSRAEYHLLSSGPNQIFDSSFGGPLVGDDLHVPIILVSTK